MGAFSIRRAAPAAFALALSIVSEGISHGGLIGEDPAPRVRSAPSIEALRTEIEKGLPEAGGRLFCVSSRTLLAELYLPLSRGGLLKELFVLLPAEGGLANADLSEIRGNLEQAGVSELDRASFRLDCGTVRGRIEGAAVHLFPLTRIPATDGPEGMLVLDPAFVLAVYRNEVKTPVVGLAWKLIVTLRTRNVRARDTVLLDLPPVDDASLRYGFLPALLGEMIASPSAFADSPPEKWDLLQQAETSFFFAQYPESTMSYRRYLERNPGDASACYKIAVMAARDLDDATALHWLNRAAAADGRFERAFAEAADYFVRRKFLDQAERVLRGGVAAFPKSRRMATSLAGFLIMRGRELAESGDAQGAGAYFSMAAQVDGADAEVREQANRLKESATGSR